jgi:hypothetical protein
MQVLLECCYILISSKYSSFDWQHICYVWRTCFSNTVGIPMCTNCAPLLAVLFLYSHEADFIQGLLKKNENKLTWSLVTNNVPSICLLILFMLQYIDEYGSACSIRVNFINPTYISYDVITFARQTRWPT